MVKALIFYCLSTLTPENTFVDVECKPLGYTKTTYDTVRECESFTEKALGVTYDWMQNSWAERGDEGLLSVGIHCVE